jgi:hypothetical protein
MSPAAANIFLPETMSQPSSQNSEREVFPAPAPTFHLRGDFPQELGYLELLHQPVDADKVTGFFECLLKRAMPRHLIQAILAQFETCPPPRYFAYHEILTPACPNQVCCWLTDGQLRMFVDPAGLWNDMLARLAAVTKWSPALVEAQIQPRLFDELPPDPQDQWALPGYAILHDTWQCRAGLVPLAHARAFLVRNYRDR